MSKLALALILLVAGCTSITDKDGTWSYEGHGRHFESYERARSNTTLANAQAEAIRNASQVTTTFDSQGNPAIAGSPAAVASIYAALAEYKLADAFAYRAQTGDPNVAKLVELYTKTDDPEVRKDIITAVITLVRNTPNTSMATGGGITYIGAPIGMQSYGMYGGGLQGYPQTGYGAPGVVSNGRAFDPRDPGLGIVENLSTGLVFQVQVDGGPVVATVEPSSKSMPIYATPGMPHRLHITAFTRSGGQLIPASRAVDIDQSIDSEPDTTPGFSYGWHRMLGTEDFR